MTILSFGIIIRIFIHILLLLVTTEPFPLRINLERILQNRYKKILSTNWLKLYFPIFFRIFLKDDRALLSYIMVFHANNIFIIMKGWLISALFSWVSFLIDFFAFLVIISWVSFLIDFFAFLVIIYCIKGLVIRADWMFKDIFLFYAIEFWIMPIGWIRFIYPLRFTRFLL